MSVDSFNLIMSSVTTGLIFKIPYKTVSIMLSLLISVSKFMNINLLKFPGNSICAGTRVSIRIEF